MKLFLSLIFLLSTTCFAKQTTKLTFTDARIFAPLKGSVATAGYAEISNTTDKDVALTISKVAPFKAVETHETIEKDGRMAMVKVEKFVVPAKGKFMLKQGGNHIMLFEPSREVKADEELVVEFMVDGQQQDVKFKVIPRVEKPKSEHSKH